MLLSLKASLVYTATQACDALLQVEPTTDDAQRVTDARLLLLSGTGGAHLPGEDGIGLRRWVSVGPRLDCLFEATVEVTRTAPDLRQLTETPLHDLPASALPYLMPSRYCQSDLFLDFTASQFAGLTGGAAVQTMCDWVATTFTYDIFASGPGTSATDSFAAQRGVCRDYAHVLIALVRAIGIPARFVSAFGPDVDPQDFHAVVEVFLEGHWHLVDATGMAKPEDIVRICVGRDAADTSFLTSYGPLALQEQTVEVRRKGERLKAR